METIASKKEGDSYRQTRWKQLHDTLHFDLVVDCINLIEGYDATQVMDMVARRNFTEIWLQRYYVDTNTLIWMYQIDLTNHNHMFAWDGQLWIMHTDDEEEMPIALLSQYRKPRIYYGTPYYYNISCGITRHGKIYKITVNITDQKMNLYIKETYTHHWKKQFSAINDGFENYLTRLMIHQNRVFIFGQKQFTEVLPDGLKVLPLLPCTLIDFYVSNVTSCELDDDNLLVMVNNFQLLTFNIFTYQWTRIEMQSVFNRNIEHRLFNINHTVYLLKEYSPRTKKSIPINPMIFKLDFHNKLWHAVSTLPHAGELDKVCIYVPSL